MNSSKHWSNYWSGGHLTSLPQDFHANYDGEIAGFWRRQFERLQPRARMLDVCTGNGAIALLAAAWARQQRHPLEIIAIDAARIDPTALAAKHPEQADLLAEVRFLGEQPLETYSPDAAFDLVTSQYGIEYCDWNAAAERVGALLRPGGRFAMVCHASSSDIMATMRAELADYEFLEQLGLLADIEAFLDGGLAHAEFRQRIKVSGERLYQQFQAGRSPLLATLLKTLNAILPLTEAELRQQAGNLENFHQHLVDGRDRLQDMLRVNAAIHEQPDWYRLFERHGLALTDSGEILYREAHASGRWYQLDKLER